MGKVAEKTQTATDNYSQMVVASDIKNKVLTEVYSDETTKTTNNINNALSTLRTKLSNLNTKLTNLREELRQANISLQSIDSSLSSARSSLASWNSQKRSDYYNMCYYS
ncbi:MAG: hypothetical protein PUC65_05305 [Clostridiales bacterium]|nr:hypothetical protein [Clostridiales bacterium]